MFCPRFPGPQNNRHTDSDELRDSREQFQTQTFPTESGYRINSDRESLEVKKQHIVSILQNRKKREPQKTDACFRLLCSPPPLPSSSSSSSGYIKEHFWSLHHKIEGVAQCGETENVKRYSGALWFSLLRSFL